MSDTNAQVKDFTGTVVVPAKVGPAVGDTVVLPNGPILEKPGVVVKVVGQAAPASPAPPKPPLPALAPKTNVAALAKAASPVGAIPKGLVSASTDTILNDSFFRAVLYSVTAGFKTSTAAEFEDPEFVRIILTRDPSQLIPLAGLGYKYVRADTASNFEYAMKNPEVLWPEWAKLADPDKRRTLIVDDLTKALDVIVKSATVKDNRMAYRDAKNTLDDLVTSLSAKPYNIILITLAKIGDNIRDEEQIGPEMSPSLRNYVEAEFSAVLYIDPSRAGGKGEILTGRDKFGIAVEDANGKAAGTKQRCIFAKVKLPKQLAGQGLIKLWEPRDLRALWKKLKAAQLAGVKK